MFRLFGGEAGVAIRAAFRRFGGVLWLGRCFAGLGAELGGGGWGGVFLTGGGGGEKFFLQKRFKNY